MLGLEAGAEELPFDGLIGHGAPDVPKRVDDAEVVLTARGPPVFPRADAIGQDILLIFP